MPSGDIDLSYAGSGDITLRDGVLVDTPQGYQDQGVTLPYE
jgi:hypothetical protein